MAQIFNFDGDISRIKCQNTSSFTMEEIYSRWKDWVLTSDNAKYLQAFRFVGGDPTVGGKSLGVTYFLMNNWRIVPYTGSLDYDLNVEGNLFLDEATNAASASNPYEFPGILVRQEVSNLTDSQVLESEISQRLEYGGIVYLDTDTGTSGSTYPVGTSASPVNNFSQAVDIANTFGFHKILAFDDIALNSNANFLTISAITNGVTFTLLGDSYNYDNSEFENATIRGVSNSNTHYRNCTLADIVGVNGLIGHCGLSGSISIKNGGTAIFHDCYSGIPGLDSPALNYSGSSNTMTSMRNYSGGISICSSSAVSNVMTIEFIAGRFNIRPCTTDGFISIRGVATINDTGTTATLESGSLVDPSRFGGLLRSTNTKITEVHQIHGLEQGSPLNVSTSARSAASISQTIVTGSGTTTVTRT